MALIVYFEPMPISMTIAPKADTVVYANNLFRICWPSAIIAPKRNVTPPIVINNALHSMVPPRIDDILAKRYTPAFTIVDECKYALAGVGACIAPGSQK